MCVYIYIYIYIYAIIKETTFISKSYGEIFTLWCSSRPCTATTITDSNVYNLTKITDQNIFIREEFSEK